MELLVVAEFPGFLEVLEVPEVLWVPGVLVVLWVPGFLVVQGFLEALEALARALSFHLVLINLHSKEVLHHSWVLILSMDLR